MYIIEPTLNNQEFTLLPSKDELDKINVIKRIESDSKTI